MNKREFMLGACALVGTAKADAGAAAPCTKTAETDPARAARPPELAPDLALATWRHYLGDDFAAPGGPLQLTEVRAEPSSGASSEQFSLLFAGPVALAAGTHALRHGTGQRVSLFMQPAGLSAQGRALYRADFNRLL